MSALQRVEFAESSPEVVSPFLTQETGEAEGRDKILVIQNLNKTYRSKVGNVQALKDVSIEVRKGDIFGVIGMSGAGKSTLIRSINLLERPDGGRVIIGGTDITLLGEKELERTRQKIGMIFQHFNLLKSRTVYENVAFPLRFLRKSKAEICEKVNALLELVGLTDKANNYPSQLSGGQKQRVAIARALVNDPEILLSDEATSALDPQTTDSILSLLQELNEKLGLTIVLITHEMNVVKKVCNKLIVLQKGKVIESGPVLNVFSNPHTDITERMLSELFKTDSIQYLLEHTDIDRIIRDTGAIVHLFFQGEKANNSYIAQLIRNFKIDASIIYGNIELVQHAPLGSLFLAITGKREQINAALDYLRSENIRVTLIKEY